MPVKTAALLDTMLINPVYNASAEPTAIKIPLQMALDPIYLSGIKNARLTTSKSNVSTTETIKLYKKKDCTVDFIELTVEEIFDKYEF